MQDVRSLTQVLFDEIGKIFKNTFFNRTPPVAASANHWELGVLGEDQGWFDKGTVTVIILFDVQRFNKIVTLQKGCSLKGAFSRIPNVSRESFHL